MNRKTLRHSEGLRHCRSNSLGHGVDVHAITLRQKFLLPEGGTYFFTIWAGLLQGDTWAPFLFIITLVYAMRSAIEDYEELGFTMTERRTLSHNMTDTDLADDIALISENLDKSQLLLERDEPAATEVGLYINNIKTEYMACTLRQQGDLATLDN